MSVLRERLEAMLDAALWGTAVDQEQVARDLAPFLVQLDAIETALGLYADEDNWTIRMDDRNFYTRKCDYGPEHAQDALRGYQED